MRTSDKFYVGVVVFIVIVIFSQGCAITKTNTNYEAVCANLAALGCSEGQDPTCAPTMKHVQEERLTDLKPACLESARTVGEAQACGTVVCVADDQAARDAQTSCSKACLNVKGLGCPEADSCLETCQAASNGAITSLNLPCLSAAKTKDAVRLCGSLTCL